MLLKLSDTDVHLFHADLNLPVGRIQELAETLSEDEQLRADRFYFERDKKYFITCRGILRQILARYYELEPSQLQFAYGINGKPTLTDNTNPQMLCFNLSHSNGLAIFAVTKNRSIGVDLEYIRKIPDVQQLAKRFFSKTEYAMISSLPQDKQEEGFLHIWTLKEAYLKATGEGLTGLEQIEVSMMLDKTSLLDSIKNNPLGVKNWTCAKLIPVTGYVAAVVVEGYDWDLHSYAA
jgi:4'-phosphopantetheinyl transferase